MDTEVLTAEREIINETDREMARLFEQRMEAVKRIAMWKKEHGLPILDAGREQACHLPVCLVDDLPLRGQYFRIHGVSSGSGIKKPPLFLRQEAVDAVFSSGVPDRQPSIAVL